MWIIIGKALCKSVLGIHPMCDYKMSFILDYVRLEGCSSTTNPRGLSLVDDVVWLHIQQSYVISLTIGWLSSEELASSKSMPTVACSMNFFCLLAKSAINFCCLSLALLLLKTTPQINQEQ